MSGTGLVEVTPRKGVTVARIDAGGLNDMFEALAEFEALCAKLGAVPITMLEKKRLVNFNREQRILDGTEALAPVNNEFHEIVYRGAPNASIVSVTRSFRHRLAPSRALQFVPGQTEHAFHERDKIVEAIVRSDAQGAYTVMRDHVTDTGLQVIEISGRLKSDQLRRYGVDARAGR